MVGYKNEENLLIGWFPANLDDIINYIPARICGLLIVLSAFLLNLDYKNSYKIMKRDARVPPSPNSGFSMAATAGALNVELVKPNTYILGDPNEKLTTKKINDAIKLTKMTTLLFIITTFIIFKIIYVFLPIFFL
jgi:adenosylcobinamide-phosphate synthase